MSDDFYPLYHITRRGFSRPCDMHDWRKADQGEYVNRPAFWVDWSCPHCYLLVRIEWDLKSLEAEGPKGPPPNNHGQLTALAKERSAHRLFEKPEEPPAA